MGSHTFWSILMLTVKFRQPSHEFTFGVDISYILYPLVLTPLVYQVHSCMSVLEFSVYAGFWRWKQDFRDNFIKHLVQDLEAPYKSCNEANLTPRSPGTKPEKMTNSDDLSRKVSNLAGQGATSNSERNWRQGPTCRRGKDLEDSGTDATRRRQATGLGGPRPAGPAHSRAQSSPPPPLT
jgi:hypothetical protein